MKAILVLEIHTRELKEDNGKIWNKTYFIGNFCVGQGSNKIASFVCLSVCMSVCECDYSENCGLINLHDISAEDR